VSTKISGKLSKSKSYLGMTVVNGYQVMEELGRGAVGIVKLCINQEDQKKYAIKIVPRGKQTGFSAQVCTEISLLAEYFVLEYPC
jgi:serine/threonine protein kinase